MSSCNPPEASPKALSPAHVSWRWRILISTYFAYGGFYLTRKVFTICKTTIAKDLHWQLSDTAHIWTAYLVAYMLGMFINSFIGRRWGPRVLLLGGLGLSIVETIINNRYLDAGTGSVVPGSQYIQIFTNFARDVVTPVLAGIFQMPLISEQWIIWNDVGNRCEGTWASDQSA